MSAARAYRVVIAVALAMCCAGAPHRAPVSADEKDQGASANASVPAKKEVPPMSTAEIVAQIRAKDWSLIENQTAIPIEAVPDIAALMSLPDQEVRELATYALNAADGPAATDALLKALTDPNDIVRGNAARFLHGHATRANLEILQHHMATNEDEFVREQAALILGRLGDPSSVKPLDDKRRTESYPDARHAMSLALVRLGEEKQTTAYIERLSQGDPQQRVAAVEDLQYIGDKKFIPHVLPLLKDFREAKNVGPSHGPYYIRVCDVVVNVLDKMLNKPFPFPVSNAKRYSSEELAQAARTLAKS